MERLRVSAVGLLAAVSIFAAGCLGPTDEGPFVVDDFEDVGGWTAVPADGVDLSLSADDGNGGQALRLDFDFHGGGGYAVAHRDVDLDLPDNYVFTFTVRGEAPPNHLEFKLIDETGENVWWHVDRDVEFPATWTHFRIKKRQISFAWGPAGGGTIRHVAAIEFAVTAGSGGKGTVWIDDLELVPLPPPDATPPEPVASASSLLPGHGPELAVDGDPTTFWAPEPGDEEPWIEFDLGGFREFGGLAVQWAPLVDFVGYSLNISEDGTTYRGVEEIPHSNGGRDDFYLPESEARFIRLSPFYQGPAKPPAVAELVVRPLSFSATREAFFTNLAADAPRGTYPRGITGEQSYWTVLGVDGGAEKGLINEDGMIESGRGSFSVEPFLHSDEGLVTWADVEASQTLLDGYLPIPTVAWDAGGLGLRVTAFGRGERDASSIVARYRVENRRAKPVSGTLYLAVRPFQVNPPSQSLNLAGGTARIREIAADGATISVNGSPRVFCLTPADAFGAAPFHYGELAGDFLRDGRLPEHTSARDDFEAAAGALSFPFALEPGASREVDLVITLPGGAPPPAAALEDASAGRAWTAAELARCRERWQEKLDTVVVEIPGADPRVTESVKSQLAYILLNRKGPAIQPGVRSYARSWIRDGALTSSALLRLGQHDAARAFLEWYAPHQYANGKIPCVVDSRGADPVPEHDSSGEFIFLVAEVYRHTGDLGLAREMFPRVARAAAYLDSLRHETLGAEYDGGANRIFRGLLPPSISHEGYSAKPMHSYWDDFWAVKGFRDAAFLAGKLGKTGAQARWDSVAVAFEADVAASVVAAMAQHGIDHVPGCADLGDFDATSTTVAFSPTGAARILPDGALHRTFAKYFTFFSERRDGADWEAFTPYEIRNIGAFVHLGWRERAGELLDYFLNAQRPPGWRQWAEVVAHDARAPRFIGDMPHTWVGSDYIRSVLDMLAYEREADEALVIGAGIQPGWLDDPSGITVRGLSTRYGPLAYTIQREGETIVVRIEDGPRVPPGGILVSPPAPGLPAAVTVNGTSMEVNPDGSVTVGALPAMVRFTF